MSIAPWPRLALIVVTYSPSQQDHGPRWLDFDLTFSLCTQHTQAKSQSSRSNVFDLSRRTVEGQGRVGILHSHTNVGRTQARHEATSAANLNHALSKGKRERKSRHLEFQPYIQPMYLCTYTKRDPIAATRAEHQQAGRQSLVRDKTRALSGSSRRGYRRMATVHQVMLNVM